MGCRTDREDPPSSCGDAARAPSACRPLSIGAGPRRDGGARVWVRRVVLVLACAMLSAGIPVASGWAATIDVTTTGEDPFASSTGCSLREAVISANRALVVGGCPAGDAGVENTIVLQAGATYTLMQPDAPQFSFMDRASWYGPNGLPPIASRITIEGNGATIARSPFSSPFRLFFVGAGPGSPNSTYTAPPPGPGVLTLRDVTLEGGWAKGGDSFGGGGGAGMGGAIFSQGTLVIDHSTLTGNAAQGGSAIDPSAGGSGGGIGTNSGASGGGFGPGAFGGATGGAGASSEGGSGGGAGFGTTDNGSPGVGPNGGKGGGSQTGLAGAGSGTLTGTPGSGGDGGGGGGEGFGEVAGAPFGFGGKSGGGGGGVGGGGGGQGAFGGGGFGGGGGAFGIGFTTGGSGGGFGGGGGGGTTGSPGFGGGTPTATQGGGGAGMGGAIFNMQGQLTITDSTLTGNTALGGLDLVPDPGKGIAGAVFNLSGAFTATGSTIAGNQAANYASQVFNVVADEATARTAHTTLRDTIVADGVGGSNPSTAPSFNSSDVTSDQTNYPGPNKAGASATVDESAFDLVTASHPMELGTVTGTPSTSDPLLGPLVLQGGSTPTMAPQSGSPAIDAGAAFALTTDQRGLRRPFDFSGVADAPGGDGSDIGAVEVQPACNGQTSPSQGCGAPGGSPTAGSTGAGRPASPAVTGARESNHVWVEGNAPVRISRTRKHPVGTVFSFTLNETASVRFVFLRAQPGRKVGRRCVTPNTHNRHGHACTRLVAAGALAFTGHTGVNKLAFEGRVSPTRKLTLGSYALQITATDPAGHSSTPQSLRFTIVRR